MSSTRTKSGKPRKGVMPPALKKYWATHRHKHSQRKKNPTSKRTMKHLNVFKLVAKRAGKSLVFNGVKFTSSNANPVFFPTMDAAKAMAQHQVNKHPALRHYKFFAVPR